MAVGVKSASATNGIANFPLPFLPRVARVGLPGNWAAAVMASFCEVSWRFNAHLQCWDQTQLCGNAKTQPCGSTLLCCGYKYALPFQVPSRSPGTLSLLIWPMSLEGLSKLA